MISKIAPASRIEFSVLVIAGALSANAPALAAQHQGSGIGVVLQTSQEKTATTSNSTTSKAKSSGHVAPKKAQASQGPSTGNK